MAGWTAVHIFVTGAEAKSDISEVGEDNGVSVSIAQIVESNPAVFASG